MAYFTRLMLTVLGVVSVAFGIGQFVDLSDAASRYSGAVGQGLDAVAFAWLGSGIVGWAVLWFFACVLREIEAIRMAVAPQVAPEVNSGAGRAGDGWLTEKDRQG